MVRRLIAAALLPAILLLGFAPAYAVYRCTFDGVARRECCCPATERALQDSPAVSERCCCDVSAVQLAAAHAAPANASVHAIAYAAVVTAPIVVRPLLSVAVVRSERASAIGPPPLQRKQTLLI